MLTHLSGVILWDIVMEKRLSFTPSALFMLGSPLGVFLHTGYGVAGSHALCKELGKARSSNAFLHVNSFPSNEEGTFSQPVLPSKHPSHFIVRIADDDSFHTAFAFCFVLDKPCIPNANQYPPIPSLRPCFRYDSSTSSTPWTR